jgi:hypothetical protein
MWKRALILTLVLFALTEPASAQLASDNCRKCHSYWDSLLEMHCSYCRRPENNDWGTEECTTHSWGTWCSWCEANGNGCLYIEVNG